MNRDTAALGFEGAVDAADRNLLKGPALLEERKATDEKMVGRTEAKK